MIDEVRAQSSNKNPILTDLSDSKRPTKLAEMYTECYDNEWTEAFEELETMEEKERIRWLYTILWVIFYFCIVFRLKLLGTKKNSVKKSRYTFTCLEARLVIQPVVSFIFQIKQ